MAKRNLTLWQMLVWTYRDQKAHALLRHPDQWLRFAVAVVEAQDPDTPRPAVHPDAATLHAMVTEMGENDACLLLEFAGLGVPPERCHTQPVAYPMDACRASGKNQDERWSWSNVNGRRIDYLIRTAEDAVEVTEIYETKGRKKVELIGTEMRKTPVEFCPLRWEPDPVWREMVDATYDNWLAAMRRLHGLAAEVAFGSHLLIGLGVQADTSGSPVLVFSDASRSERPEDVVGVQLYDGRLGSLDGENFYKLWARARRA